MLLNRKHGQAAQTHGRSDQKYWQTSQTDGRADQTDGRWEQPDGRSGQYPCALRPNVLATGPDRWAPGLRGLAFDAPPPTESEMRMEAIEIPSATIEMSSAESQMRSSTTRSCSARIGSRRAFTFRTMSCFRPAPPAPTSMLCASASYALGPSKSCFAYSPCVCSWLVRAFLARDRTTAHSSDDAAASRRS